MTSVKGWHTGRVWLMTPSASLRIVVICSSLLSCIKKPYLDLEKNCQVAETMVFPDWLIRSFLLNPKYNYTVLLCKKIQGTIDRMELVYALQEDSRNDRENGAGDIFGTAVRNKRHGVEDSSGQEYHMGGYMRWSEAYLVTLTDRCFFLCVPDQRGTIAKSMYEEHLCVVASTSMERGAQFFPLASYLLV